MNFEHLIKYIVINKHRIKDLNRIKKFLKYHYDVLKLNRQKLKLGNITFVIHEFDIKNPLKEHISIKFINQDTSNSDEERLQRFNEELG